MLENDSRSNVCLSPLFFHARGVGSGVCSADWRGKEGKRERGEEKKIRHCVTRG